MRQRGTSSQENRLSPFGEKNPMGKRLLIVGGGAGGAGTAAKAKRIDPGLEVILLQSGEHVAYAT